MSVDAERLGFGRVPRCTMFNDRDENKTQFRVRIVVVKSSFSFREPPFEFLTKTHPRAYPTKRDGSEHESQVFRLHKSIRKIILAASGERTNQDGTARQIHLYSLAS